MPSKTAKQARAMAAACKGRGKIGIPRKVACELHKHDRAKGKGRKR